MCSKFIISVSFPVLIIELAVKESLFERAVGGPILAINEKSIYFDRLKFIND